MSAGLGFDGSSHEAFPALLVSTEASLPLLCHSGLLSLWNSKPR